MQTQKTIQEGILVTLGTFVVGKITKKNNVSFMLYQHMRYITNINSCGHI